MTSLIFILLDILWLRLGLGKLRYHSEGPEAFFSGGVASWFESGLGKLSDHTGWPGVRCRVFKLYLKH